MKKINSLVLSTITAAFLVGCGGGGGGSSSTPTTTSVPATKGPLLMATAVDSSNPAKIGTQIEGTNKYTFTGTVNYPIIVTGGYIDANNNGEVDAGEKPFEGTLKSFSNLVTPTTTYLGDPKSADYKTRLDKIKELTGASDEDILNNDPADRNNYNAEMMALNGTLFNLFPDIMKKDPVDMDLTINESDFKTRFEILKSIQNDETLTDAEKLQKVEEEMTSGSDLVGAPISAEKASEIKSSLFTLTQAMISGKEMLIIDEYGEITVQFKADGTYAETFEDFDGSSGTCSGTWAFSKDLKNTLDMNIRCSDNNNVPETFKLIFTEEPKNGSKFKLESKDEEDEVYTITTIKNIETSTSGGSETPTSDSFVSGRTLIALSNDQFQAFFYKDGTYSEEGMNYKCSGLWKDLGNYKIGVTCQEKGTNEIPDGIIDANSNEIIIQFSSNSPTSQDKITVTDYEGKEEMSIGSFMPISINVTDSMISGKTITLDDGITYTFNADKTFTSSESGLTTKFWETSFFLNLYYEDDGSMKTFVFTEIPKIGSVIYENSAANNFSSVEKVITNIK